MFGFKEIDTKQAEYFEQQKNISISCNSEECEEIGQKTMIRLFFYFSSLQKR